ncbi:MAG: glycosyltransferase 87 family protein, partial [Pseudomonadota bacterium]|nr:glycosyltransferase 87 family protein [Pseudomonadota bacterium]
YVAAFLPGVLLGEAVGGDAGGRLGLGLSILFWDLVLLLVLGRIAGDARSAKVTRLYWLSPITVYVGYWHGQLDVFPAALLAASLLAIAGHRQVRAGLLYGAAVAAKLSMVLPAPFILLYFLGQSRLRRSVGQLIVAAALVAGALFLPFCLSPGFRQMVLYTPETAKIFSFSLLIGRDLSLYFLPIACLGLLYAAWRVRRLDFEMLWAFTGVVFMAFLLLTPASPGWAMWTLPFVVLHVARAPATARALYVVFSCAFVGLHLLASPGPVVLGHFDLSSPLSDRLPGIGDKAASVLFTIALTSGAGLAVQMLLHRVLETPFRAATRRPLVLGVAGDSGSGKDTLIASVAGMFGRSALAHLSGDDYHVWDRHKPMWRALTHLNPKANNLGAFAKHLISLSSGHTIWSPRYDHATGRMMKPVRIAASEIIAASGLHALWSPVVNRLYDVRIYLDMDEGLRRFLKIRRDVGTRGHLESKVVENLERREPDAVRFIHPQAEAADVVLRLEPRRRSTIEAGSQTMTDPPLRLTVTARPGEDFDHLVRTLASLCGIQAIERPLDSGDTEIAIEGEPTSDDIAAASRRLAPHLKDLLQVHPQWEGGLKGVIQLVVLDQIDRACRRRSMST